jgi:DNA-binding transcriptional LysR family regulator
MELRHLRYFVAVAEELHFLRAAQRLHIEQSPLSRAIKELEANLGVRLLERTTRSTRLTRAGEVFLEEARRVLSGFAQARASARAAAKGRKGRLRIGFAEGVAEPRLSGLLARYRAEAGEVDLKITQMSLEQQLKALHAGSLDAGLAFAPARRNGIQAEPVWADQVVAVLPSQHPLAKKTQIELKEIAGQPLVLCGGDAGMDRNLQLEGVLLATGDLPNVIDHAENQQVQLTLVGAGYGLGLLLAAHAETIQRPDIVVRPIASPAPLVKTFLLYRTDESSGPVAGFLARARSSS